MAEKTKKKEELPEWAQHLPDDLVEELRKRGLLLPGGPGLQRVPGKPGLWVHPNPYGRPAKETDGDVRGTSPKSRSSKG